MCLQGIEKVSKLNLTGDNETPAILIAIGLTNDHPASIDSDEACKRWISMRFKLLFSSGGRLQKTGTCS